jgi:FAD/FMN-containing dehydrogenase/Fe-S oxidoreductase
MSRSNPFLDPESVKESVDARLESMKAELLSLGCYTTLKKQLDRYWAKHQELMRFQQRIKQQLGQNLSERNISDSPHALVQAASDATGLIMEVPLLALFPENTEEVQHIVKLANEEGFSIVPRGGGTGLTGGAIPASSRSVIVSLSKLKRIFSVDPQERLLHVQSGVITLDAIKAAEKEELLFTVDPASKVSSSVGGNIAENAGGPYAFEYGTTLDNIYSYKMVTPTGEIIEVKRKDHPWHKIYPDDEVVFEVFGETGEVIDSVRLRGDEIRTPGLGKDVTNKYLGGLPGVQKEGVDGVITEARFILHPMLAYSQTLCLEFYGASMHNAALVIEDLVNLRNNIRQRSNAVTMSALEEFGAKYVKAIEYEKKSQQYEGEPISVLLIQLDSNEERLLEDVVWTVVDIADRYDNVDVLVARDELESGRFWEDRHKLSAISRRTSGFKVNEDIVIPLNKIPDFSDYLESLNVYYLTLAYRQTLLKLNELPGIDPDDEFIQMELQVCSNIMHGEIESTVLAEQEFLLQIHYFFQDLFGRYPELKAELTRMEQELFDYRLEIANHMHAGDGNCHVNIPVHANSEHMVHQAESAVAKVFEKVQELGGEVSGEHGIGITKIGYLTDDKIQAIKQYKRRVDPGDAINPGKLLQKDLVVEPYTLSWDALFEDVEHLSLFERNKEVLEHLKHIRICTRCGKCKQVCPMYYPEKGYLYHPRNKNVSLGFLLEGLCYTQYIHGTPDQELFDQLHTLVDYCTTCGKCMNICPVKIDSADITLNIRSYLEQQEAASPRFKSRMLDFFSRDPERIQLAAKAAAVSMPLHTTALRFIPPFWRRRFQNPLFQVPGTRFEVRNFTDLLKPEQGNIFVPEEQKGREGITGVLYFPGCGSGLFYSHIALAGMYLLLRAGMAVIVPHEHKCCGFPLLFSGCAKTFERNKDENLRYFYRLLEEGERHDVSAEFLLTSCGTCRAAFEDYHMDTTLSPRLKLMDVAQFVLPHLKARDLVNPEQDRLIYHSSCHSAWTDVPQNQAAEIYSSSLEDFLQTEVDVSSYCCAESGLGALTAPGVYNSLRSRKRDALKSHVQDYGGGRPILVSCPSCKIGISRIVHAQKLKQRVVHTLEYIAENIGGQEWREEFLRRVNNSESEEQGMRYVNMDFEVKEREDL